VVPGEDLPTSRDLLTEATLPPEERALQRRFHQVERFSLFLPPSGKVVLPGPDPLRVPTDVEGLYHLLLRIEASNDREGDSNLALAGAGNGVVHSGAVAGFPIPPLRYYVGSGPSAAVASGGLQLLAPARDSTWSAGAPLTLSWTPHAAALLYQVQIQDGSGKPLHAALVQQGVGSYQLPGYLATREATLPLRWRVRALGPDGAQVADSEWRELRAAPATSP
jgi:hypothetical protein